MCQNLSVVINKFLQISPFFSRAFDAMYKENLQKRQHLCIFAKLFAKIFAKIPVIFVYFRKNDFRNNEENFRFNLLVCQQMQADGGARQ
jgi:hypothetical protein